MVTIPTALIRNHNGTDTLRSLAEFYSPQAFAPRSRLRRSALSSIEWFNVVVQCGRCIQCNRPMYSTNGCRIVPLANIDSQSATYPAPYSHFHSHFCHCHIASFIGTVNCSPLALSGSPSKPRPYDAFTVR